MNIFLEKEKKYGDNIEFHNLNLTPEEFFDIMISSKKINLRPYINENELNFYSVRNWLNYNANIFMDKKCSKNKTGVYNKETMNFINLLLETKLYLYNFFYNFSKKSKNWQKSIKDLLIEFNVFHEFIPKEIEDPFCDDVYAERKYWNKMFTNVSFDLLVQFVGLDKIETQLSNTITTSKPNIYEEFFNPLVMGYRAVTKANF